MSSVKTTRWSFTAYVAQWAQIHEAEASMQGGETHYRMIKYQTEKCPTTGREHYQGAIQTIKQMRWSGIVKLLPGIHIEAAKNWPALLAYCEKSDTQVPGGRQVQVESTYRPKKIHELLTEFANIYLDEINFREMNAECKNCGRGMHKCTCNKSETDRQTDDIEYWFIARIYLGRHPEMAGLIGQPMPQNLWKNTKQVWIDRARS